MTVAALYDIHGNLPALEAVLDAIRQEDIDQVVVGGDVVPGPMPSQTLAALLDLPVPVQFIRGNGENDVLTQRRGEALHRVPEQVHEVVRWAAAELSAEQVAAIEGWPPTMRLEVAGVGDVLFCHATPRDDNELFTRITPEQHLEPIFAATGADLVVCGHTHMQFDRTIGAVRVVNAGSVGMPFGEPGAYWLLLGEDVELRCTPYDFAAASGRIAATEYPPAVPFELMHPPPEARMLEAFEARAVGNPEGG